MTALKGLQQRLRTARLQVITDLGSGSDFPALCRRLYRAGVDIVQVRDSTTEPATRRRLLEQAAQVAFEEQQLLVIGRDVDLAVTLGADAYHVQAGDGELARVRSRLHPYALVGQSVHDEDELDEAIAVAGAPDYLLVGPVLSSDPEARVGGLALVEAAARTLPPEAAVTPWFAVGGITPVTLDDVLEAGAVRVAVSSAITEADDPAEVARALAGRLDELWREREDLRRVVTASWGGGAVFTERRAPGQPGRDSR